MSKTRTKEQLLELVGQELGTSEWFAVDQDRIDQFADVTEDHQFIHVDPDRAVAAGLDGTIAHGMLTLSMIVGFCRDFAPALEGPKMVINYGLDKVRFPSPVKVNSRIRARRTLVSAELKSPTTIQTKQLVVIEIEGEEKPGCAAESLTRLIYA